MLPSPPAPCELLRVHERIERTGRLLVVVHPSQGARLVLELRAQNTLSKAVLYATVRWDASEYPLAGVDPAAAGQGSREAR